MFDKTPQLFRAAQLLTMVPDGEALRREPDPTNPDAVRQRDRAICGLIEDGGVYIEGGEIAWAGPWDERPEHLRGGAVDTEEVGCLSPGWIDCHTHAVFAGSRHEEFTLRSLGADYVDILVAGGGILSTVEDVRDTSEEELTEALIRACYEATSRGVTTLEVKSGYGLATAPELKQLRCIQAAGPEVLLNLEATFLGAHAIPRDYRDEREAYIDLVCEEMIPAVCEEELARFCDVFCDRGAFTDEEAERILEVGKDHGLIPRIHADELSPAGAAEVAARVGASSADHLEYVSDAAIEAMAQAGVTAVLLPAVNLSLGSDTFAPARDLLAAGVDVALSTDFNPGTAMTQDLTLIQSLACSWMHLTPGEALLGVTRSAARAIERLDDRGTIEVGKRADLTVLGVDDFWQVPYAPGHNPVQQVIWGGERVYWRSTQAVEEG